MAGTSTSVVQNNHEGFVGWYKEVEPDYRMKLYVAKISEQLVESMYLDSMHNIGVECLKLIPQRDVTLKSIFFSQNRSFRDFYSHDYFQ